MKKTRLIALILLVIVFAGVFGAMQLVESRVEDNVVNNDDTASGGENEKPLGEKVELDVIGSLTNYPILEAVSKENAVGLRVITDAPRNGYMYYCVVEGLNSKKVMEKYEGGDYFVIADLVSWEKGVGWTINTQNEYLLNMDEYTVTLYYEDLSRVICVDHQGDLYEFDLSQNVLALTAGAYSGYVYKEMTRDLPSFAGNAMTIEGGNVIRFPYPGITSLDDEYQGFATVGGDAWYAFFYREIGATTYTLVNDAALCDIRVFFTLSDEGAERASGVFNFKGNGSWDIIVSVSDNSPHEYALPQSIELVCLKGEKIVIEEA